MSRFNRNNRNSFDRSFNIYEKIFPIFFFTIFALIVGGFAYAVYFNSKIWNECRATGRTDLECTVLLNRTVTVQTDANIRVSN